MEHKFKLGVRVKDLVSGMVGIAKSRIEYINGCIQYAVQPPVQADQKYPESYYFDENQLVMVDEGIWMELGDRSNGGPESIAHDYNG